MQDTAYEEAWNDGEEPGQEPKPLTEATEAAKRKAEQERREFEDAYNDVPAKTDDEPKEGETK